MKKNVNLGETVVKALAYSTIWTIVIYGGMYLVERFMKKNEEKEEVE